MTELEKIGLFSDENEKTERSGEETTISDSNSESVVVEENDAPENSDPYQAAIEVSTKGNEYYKEILEGIKSIQETQSELKDSFEKKILQTDYQDKIIDQMHAELTKYKDDLYAQLIRPILIDIIDIRDSIIRISKSYKEKDAENQSIPNKVFYDYSYDLQDILEKNEVQIYCSTPGSNFDAATQKVIGKIATDDENLHGKVAEVITCGYSYRNRIISSEKVSVYIFEKKSEEQNG